MYTSLVRGLDNEDYLQSFNVCTFDFAVSGKVAIPQTTFIV